eukprot:CAMPEP_0194571520 /NCGR_PEP_ID=MMETSP0292-20121207/8470_1 /TAXON_ID=39354 /ORGANISM="Heterosigma akashiwo, Strain CCMP2393" /LENGTH=245 /DNA_ID=CAMNT_0039422321 /DNA_START=86 /DNA_END=820 /DNA_ORIENTATION=+
MAPSVQLGYYGLINSFVGNFLTAVGLVSQQAAEYQLAAKHPGLVSPYRDPLFCFGVACVALGVVSSIVNYGLLPLSTAAPLAAQAAAYRGLLARAVLAGNSGGAAPTGAAQRLSLLLIAVGVPLSVYGANLVDEAYSLDKVLDLLALPPALGLTAAAAAALLAAAAAAELSGSSDEALHDKKGSKETRRRGLWLLTPSGTKEPHLASHLPFGGGSSNPDPRQGGAGPGGREEGPGTAAAAAAAAA